MDEKLQKYYEYLRDKGAYVPDTFESFKTGLASDEGAKKYNAYLSKNGYQDFQTFSGSLPQDQYAPTMQVNQGMPKIDDLATTPIKPSLDNGQDGKQTPQQFSDNGYSHFMKINQGMKPLDNDRPEKYTMPSNEIFDKLNTIFTEDNNYNEKREGSRGRLDVPMEEWEKDTHQSIEKKKEKEISELNYLGYDYNDLQKNFGGLLPEVKSQLDLNKLMHMKDENPEQYVSAVSGIQVQNDFLKGLKEYKSAHPESNVDAVFGQVQQMMASVPTSYADQIKTLGALTAYAKKYTNEGDEISKKLGQYYIAGFDGIAPDTDEIIAQDKRSQYFSKNQMLALQKLDITDPAMAESAKNLELNIDTSKLPFDTQLGYQYKMRELEVQGAYQRMNGISNQMHKLIEKSKVQPLTPEEEQAYDNYSKLYESARQDFVSADKEYPLAAANDNIALAQDALGIAPHNQFTRMLLVAGQGTRNAAEGLITLPFGVKSFFLGRSQNDYLIELGLLGAMKGDEVENFKTEDKRLNITYDIGMTNDLRKFADGVKNDKNLSDAEKIGKVAAYVQSNPESISKIALEKPKFNITASAYFNTLTDALGMVAPFIATAELGGMIGLGSKASTAASVMLTGINQDIASRVESGDPNPMGNALISTSVNAGFFAGVDKLSELRKLYGTKTAIGKTISKLTDAQLKKYLENPPTALVNWFNGLSESAKESIKASVKIAAASLAGSTTNKLIEGKDITVDDLKHEATMTLLDQLGQNFVMAGIGQLRRGMAGNTNYYDIAQNGDYYLSQIDKAVQDGKMTLAAAEKSKKTLITIVKAFGRTSPIDNDGQQLSDRKLVRAFNINAEKQLREDLAGEAMPEKLKQKNDAELNNLTLHENVVYSTDNELQERRAEIVKQLGESTAGGLGDGKTNLQNELNLIDGEMRIRGIGVAQPQSEAQQEQKYEPKYTGLTKLGAVKEMRNFSNANAGYFDDGALKDDAPNGIKNEYNELRSIIDGVKFEPIVSLSGKKKSGISVIMPSSNKGDIITIKPKEYVFDGGKPNTVIKLPTQQTPIENREHVAVMNPFAEKPSSPPIEPEPSAMAATEVSPKAGVSSNSNEGGDGLSNVESFETAKGSKYVVSEDGKTSRFKTATNEQKEPQDLTAFVKFERQQSEDYLQALHGFNGQSVHLMGIIDGKVRELKTNKDARRATSHKLIIADKGGKMIDKIDAVLHPKEGYNVFDQKQVGNNRYQKHIGNEVTKINYKDNTAQPINERTTTEVSPKVGVSSNSNEGNPALKDVESLNDWYDLSKNHTTDTKEDKDAIAKSQELKKKADLLPDPYEFPKDSDERIAAISDIDRVNSERQDIENGIMQRRLARLRETPFYKTTVNAVNNLTKRINELAKKGGDIIGDWTPKTGVTEAEFNKLKDAQAVLRQFHRGDIPTPEKIKNALGVEEALSKPNTNESTPTKEVSPKAGVSSNSNEDNSALRAAESTAKALEGVGKEKGKNVFEIGKKIYDTIFSDLDTKENEIRAFLNIDEKQRDKQLQLEKGKLDKLQRQYDRKQLITENDINALEKQKEKVELIDGLLKSQKVSISDIDNQLAKYALDKYPNIFTKKETYPFYTAKGYDNVKNEIISEAYHKAKADGSNPELVKAVEDLLAPKVAPTTNTEGETQTTEAQLQEFGVPEQDVKPVTNVLTAMVDALRKAGLTAAKTVGEWLQIGKGKEKPYTLKINGEEKTVKPVNAEVVNGFYSPLEKVITESKQDKMPAKQWLDKFAKGEEAKWTGLQEWLSQQQGSVSKADIQKFLKENRIQVVEVVKGEDLPNYYLDKEPPSELGATRVDLLGDLSRAGNLDNPRFRDYLNNKYGRKGNKIYDWLVENSKVQGKYSKDTKFSEYQLSGDKENYKEVLVTMPKNDLQKDVDRLNKEISDKEENLSSVFEPINKRSNELYGKKYYQLDHNEKMEVEFSFYKDGNKKPFENLKKAQDELQNKKDEYFRLNKDKDILFKSSHFDEPNILVHLRMNTRTDSEGNKVLFIEEVQSDWGQKGKKEGFKIKPQKSDLEAKWHEPTVPEGHNPKNYSGYWDVYNKKTGELVGRNILPGKNAEQNIEEALRTYDANMQPKAIPSAPFVTDTNAWTKLGLKVALKEAVAQGAELLSWSSGEQQFERWGSEEIHWRKQEGRTPQEEKRMKEFGEKIVNYTDTPQERIEHEKLARKEGGYSLLINEQSSGANAFNGQEAGNKGDLIVHSKDDLRAAIKKNLSRERNESEIDKLTDRIWDKMQKEESGTSMPRREGMKGFYGEPSEGKEGIVGAVAKALVKELTGKPAEIVETKIKLGDKLASGYDVTIKDENGRVTTHNFDTKSQGLAWLSKQKNIEVISEKAEGIETSTHHSIEIAPELRAAVEKGQPLFKEAEAQYHIESGKNIIEAIKDFDGSPRATVALTHEIMHPTVVAIIDGAKEGNEVGKKHTETIVSEFNKANPKNKVTVEDLIKSNDAFKDGTTSKQYRQVQEFIAKSWEQYHTEGGKGFSEAFQKVLDQITKAFQSVYKSITGKQLTPELRQMFDNILGKEELSTDETTPTKEVSNEGNSALRAAESTAKALGNDKTSFQSENKDTQEIQEAKDLVKDIYDDGFKKNGKAPSVEEVKNEVAKIMGDHSYDNVIENAYGKLSKELKVTGKDVPDNSFREQGEAASAESNELSKGITKRVNDFLGKVFGVKGNKIEFANNVDEVRAKAQEGQPLFMTESIPYLSEKDVIKNSKGDVIGIKPEVEKAIREEREKIESEAKANDTYHKAPNGKPSKLTKPQWVTVRTIRFKNWFGDWEKDPDNASKVVDESGEPMVVFHGTLNDFDTFSKEETSNSSSGEREMFFVGKTPEVAEAFGAFQSFDDDAAGLNIKPAFLSSKKLFDYKDKAQLAEFKRWAVKNLGSKDMYDELYNSSLYGNGNWKVIESAEFQKFLKEKGYDGFYVTERIGSSHSVENIGVFSSSQIKSSTANKGTFDSETGDTRYMYNAKGEILGAVDPKTGKIYLNKEKLNPNTLIHESGHIWAEWADANAKDLMDAGLEKVRNSPYIKEVLSKDFYLKEALKYGEKGSEGYNRYLEKEALATAIGDEGGKFVMEAKRKSFRDWVNQLWDSVAKHFGIKDKTAEEISKMTLAEFAKGAAADILDPNAKFEKKVDDEKDSAGSEPPPISPDDTASPSGREIAGIKHKITAGVRSALGLPKYQRTSVADAQRVSDAIDLYHKQGEIKKVMDALRNNEKISPEQQLMMGLHIAALKKEASDNPTNANLKRAQEAIQLLDKLGTEASHMLRVRKNIFNDPESLADYMLSKAESLGIDADDMTIEQKQKAKEDYESEKVVKDKYEKHVKALEAKATEKDAQAELTKQVKLPHRSRKSPEETRKAAKDRIAARMAARRSDDMQFMFDAEDGSVGGTKDAEIDTETAKDIADVVRSFAEIHGDDLAKVTEDTVAYLSDIVDGIKPEDVHDVIAGKYSDKKTKSQLAETMENIRLEVKLTEKLQDELAEQNKPLHQRLKESTQSKEKIELARNQRIKTLKDKIAALQKTNRWDLQAAKQIEKLEAQNEGLRNELESAESGILKPKTKPKTAQDKREQTAREIELKKEAKEIRKQIAKTDAAILDAKKKSMQRLIDKTKEQIKKGYFETRKQTPIELDSEGIKLKNELLEVRAKRKLEQLRDEYSKRGTIKKGADMIADIINIPRAIMATGDYSAVLRQSVIATLSHPYFAKKAGVMMVKAGASQKAYDEFFYDLEHSPKYDTYVNSGLAITDRNAAEMKFHEERYMSSLASKIPIVGEPIKVKGKTKVPGLNIIKGSERAYTIYLNAMRIMLFDHYASMLEAKGKTFANSPDAYKEIAKFANNMTGRGDVGKLLNGAAPLLNAFFFSPRLIASRVNMLTYLMKPSFWSKAPVEIRRAYFRDMGIFIGTGLTTLAAFAALSSALYNDDDKNKIHVGFDPLSSDFGKIRQSNTDFDIWGGYQQYAKLAAIMFAGSRKTQTGKEIKLDGEGAFGESRGSVVGRFARGKLSPPAGIATDLMMGGETFLGEKIKWNADEKKKEISTQKYIAEHFAPMNVISVVEAAKDLGWAKALLLTVPSNVLGVGTNTYERSKKTTAPELNDGVSAYFKQHKIDVPEIKAPKEIQEKDSNGRNSGKRDLTEQEAEKYVNTWYEEFANKMKNNVIDKPENSWNGTTDDGFYFYGVKTKDLTAEQMKVVIERQKRYATESTKKKLFKKTERKSKSSLVAWM